MDLTNFEARYELEIISIDTEKRISHTLNEKQIENGKIYNILAKKGLRCRDNVFATNVYQEAFVIELNGKMVDLIDDLGMSKTERFEKQPEPVCWVR